MMARTRRSKNTSKKQPQEHDEGHPQVPPSTSNENLDTETDKEVQNQENGEESDRKEVPQTQKDGEPDEAKGALSTKKENFKSERDKSDNEQEQQENVGHQPEYTMYILLSAIIPIVVFAAINVLCTPSSVDQIDIELSLNKLANDFQNQSQLSFKKLKSRVLPYVHHKTSPQPFVLLVASTQGDQLTAECFASRVAKILAASSVTINGSKYSAAISDNAKMEIDGRLRNVFRHGKFPTAAIIQNLDSIPYDTTNLFYGYCDHDNPMYKEAAIIFTITLPQSYQISDNEVDCEGLVEKYLSEDSPWVKDEKFSIDIMGALISRITDTVIVVNKESRESLEKFC